MTTASTAKSCSNRLKSCGVKICTQKCIRAMVLCSAFAYLVILVVSTQQHQHAVDQQKSSKIYYPRETYHRSLNVNDDTETTTRRPVPVTTKVPATTKVPDKHLALDMCNEKITSARLSMRGTQYWAFYNYIKPSRHFRCNESITYTTHSEFMYLHNLEPLLERWQGPASVAVFTPGSDYNSALEAIFYYRQCLNGERVQTLVNHFVTFHFYFPIDHRPSGTFLDENMLSNYKANCDRPPPNVDKKSMDFVSYKATHRLVYPINVGRNIARESANTHYIFASDVELYPSPNLIPKFLAMVRSSTNSHAQFTQNNNKPRVYVNTIFEMKKNNSMPETKSQLLQYLEKGDAVTFHKFVCPQCHLVPSFAKWKMIPESETLDVSSVTKRQAPHNFWEPIYIGTNQDPFYDERLSWDGRADKMTQSYAMCVLDYDFMVLDSAFLIHRPGIKTARESSADRLVVRKQQKIINKQVIPELKQFLGTRKGC